MNNQFRKQYIEAVLASFHRLKELGDKALSQVSDEHFFALCGPEDNSIAILVKHMSGNMRSRWTDFLTSDGEKPDRHRDSEFEIDPETTPSALMESWEAGWNTLFAAIESLDPEDLDSTVHIRGRPYKVVEAIDHQLIHYALHVGQIIMLAKHFAHKWVTLSIPRGKSEEYTRKMFSEYGKDYP